MSNIAIIVCNRSFHLSNAFLTGSDTAKEFVTEEYLEIVLHRPPVTGGSGAWKTKKFYDSSRMAQCRLGDFSAIPEFSESAVGKAYSYVNKLLYGGWITEENYNTYWLMLGEIESKFYSARYDHSTSTMRVMPWW